MRKLEGVSRAQGESDNSSMQGPLARLVLSKLHRLFALEIPILDVQPVLSNGRTFDVRTVKSLATMPSMQGPVLRRPGPVLRSGRRTAAFLFLDELFELLLSVSR